MMEADLTNKTKTTGIKTRTMTNQTEFFKKKTYS